MRLESIFEGAAVIAISTQFASAQVTSKLFRQVEAGEELARHARVGGTLRLSGTYAVGHVAPTVRWAYAEGKEHELAHGSTADEELLWDGFNGLRRSRAGGGTTWVNQHVSGNPIGASPLRDGYLANAPLGTRMRPAWVAELLKQPDLKVETTSSGRVRLHIPLPVFHGNQTIELNPNWGFLIDLTSETFMSVQDGVSGKRTRVALHETEVFRAKNVAGVWIPTQVEDRYTPSPDSRLPVTTRGGYELVDATEKIPNSEFKLPAELRGDGPDSRNRPMNLVFAGGSPNRIVNQGVGVSMSALKALAAVAAALLLGSAVLLLRRSRRQAADYWGPPGKGPSA